MFSVDSILREFFFRDNVKVISVRHTLENSKLMHKRSVFQYVEEVRGEKVRKSTKFVKVCNFLKDN